MRGTRSTGVRSPRAHAGGATTLLNELTGILWRPVSGSWRPQDNSMTIGISWPNTVVGLGMLSALMRFSMSLELVPSITTRCTSVGTTTPPFGWACGWLRGATSRSPALNGARNSAALLDKYLCIRASFKIMEAGVPWEHAEAI